MKFNKLCVKLTDPDSQNYGYIIEFNSGLNIIRGDNSSGKSTLVNSLIYSLGMEEIIGSKGNTTLPYALKERFDLDGKEKRILSSTVYLEIENKFGKTITLKRVIKSEDADTKLIQIIEGAYLTNPSLNNLKSRYTFLHDAGSAQDAEHGFFAYLEKFIGLELPSLIDNKGKETKLYLQSIFAALIVEQKRGWTDYIANIPYFGVSGMREKVASFLLNLDNFRNKKILNELQSERSTLINRWSETVTELKFSVESNYLSISGLNRTPSTDFDPRLITVSEKKGSESKSIKDIKNELNEEFMKIVKLEKNQLQAEPVDLINNIEEVQNRIDELLTINGICSSKIKINESQLKQYIESLNSIEKDLKSNKLIEKLVRYGANEAELDFARGKCHTCMNPIDDILLPPDSISMPMSLEENITHLDNQRKMTKSILEGLESSIESDRGQLLTINREIIKYKLELTSLKRDIKSTNSIKEADIRNKINIENRISEIKKIEEKFENSVRTLIEMSERYKILNGEISELLKTTVTKSDWLKINTFSSEFKKLAIKFGYRSADVNEIEIKPDTLLPYLKDLELRESLNTPTEVATKNNGTDIKSDSSASDFVRLIWSYLIALYTTSNATGGNHLGLLLFDEPAQHSMSTKSVNRMLDTLATTKGLQSIVAASFDENEETYLASVLGLNVNSFKLIRLPRKLITRI